MSPPRKSEDETLLGVVAQLRIDHGALGGRIGALEKDFTGIRVDLDRKHAENRKSIHDLGNGQQIIVDLIHKLDMKFAKFTGYACGAGAIVALIIKYLDHLIK